MIREKLNIIEQELEDINEIANELIESHADDDTLSMIEDRFDKILQELEYLSQDLISID